MIDPKTPLVSIRTDTMLRKIRADGLDPVWNAAVRLREYVTGKVVTRQGVDEMVLSLCRAVETMSEEDNSNG